MYYKKTVAICDLFWYNGGMENKPKLICASIVQNGKIYVGKNHAEIIEEYGVKRFAKNDYARGFLNDRGEFIDENTNGLYQTYAKFFNGQRYLVTTEANIEKGKKFAEEMNKGRVEVQPIKKSEMQNMRDFLDLYNMYEGK